MFTYKKMQQLYPLYSYPKFARSGQKFRVRSQAIERIFWELKLSKILNG